MKDLGAPTKWGIMGAGAIAHDFVTSVSSDKKNHLVVSVAARSLDRAQAFATSHDIATAYGSYAELVADSNVDVVYVATITPKHIDDVQLALNAGKHVLCEKAMGVNARQTKKMIALAKEKGLFLMEGVWSRAFPCYKRLREIVADEETIGKPMHVVSVTGLGGAGVAGSRLSSPETGGGSVLDILVYNIQFCLAVFGPERPIKISASATGLNELGVDTGVSAVLSFSGDRAAVISVDLRVSIPCEASAAGTKGRIVIDNVVRPVKLRRQVVGRKCDVEEEKVEDFPLPNIGGRYNFPSGEGFLYEANEVRRCLQAGLTESPLFTLEESVIVAEIQEEINRQAGVTCYTAM